MASMESLQSDIASLQKDIKSLVKLVRKIRTHQEDPEGLKAAERSKNNGFNRPQNITHDLAEFLGVDDSEMLSRSEVTRRVNKYIRDNDLKHPDNGRIIVMDDKIKNLLKPPDGIQISFLNMQRYLSPHYVKAEGAESSVVTEAVTAAESEPEVTSTPAKKKVVRRPVVKKTPTTAA
jgi:upstream activation factor subunit UAF30